jgi:predicted nucleic acid-binding protein
VASLTLTDTSVAVALVVVDHEHHDEIASRVGSKRLGLAGHAAFETFSVLTRLPAPVRRSAPVVARILHATFPTTRFLGEDAAATLLAELATLGISGGATYDALVGAAAVHHRATLLTRDRRAAATYHAVGVRYDLLT